MSYVHTTWYVLQDGTHADPNDVAPGDDGVLRHKDGLAVAMRADGVPQTVGVDAKANKNVLAAKTGEDAADDAAADGPVTDADADAAAQGDADKDSQSETRDATADKPKRGYKTRESKAN